MTMRPTYSLALFDSKMPENKTLTIQLAETGEFHSIWNNAETAPKKSIDRTETAPDIGEGKASLEGVKRIERHLMQSECEATAADGGDDGGTSGDFRKTGESDLEFRTDDRTRHHDITDLDLAARMQRRQIGRISGSAGRAIDAAGHIVVQVRIAPSGSISRNIT